MRGVFEQWQPGFDASTPDAPDRGPVRQRRGAAPGPVRDLAPGPAPGGRGGGSTPRETRGRSAHATPAAARAAASSASRARSALRRPAPGPLPGDDGAPVEDLRRPTRRRTPAARARRRGTPAGPGSRRRAPLARSRSAGALGEPEVLLRRTGRAARRRRASKRSRGSGRGRGVGRRVVRRGTRCYLRWAGRRGPGAAEVVVIAETTKAADPCERVRGLVGVRWVLKVRGPTDGARTSAAGRRSGGSRDRARGRRDAAAVPCGPHTATPRASSAVDVAPARDVATGARDGGDVHRLRAPSMSHVRRTARPAASCAGV